MPLCESQGGAEHLRQRSTYDVGVKAFAVQLYTCLTLGGQMSFT